MVGRPTGGQKTSGTGGILYKLQYWGCKLGWRRPVILGS